MKREEREEEKGWQGEVKDNKQGRRENREEQSERKCLSLDNPFTNSFIKLTETMEEGDNKAKKQSQTKVVPWPPMYLVVE